MDSFSSDNQKPSTSKAEDPKHQTDSSPSSKSSSSEPVPSTSRQPRRRKITLSGLKKIVQRLRRRNRELLNHVQTNELWTLEELRLELRSMTSLSDIGRQYEYNRTKEDFYDGLYKRADYMKHLINVRLEYLNKNMPVINTVPRLRPKSQRKSSFIRWLEQQEEPRDEGNETDESHNDNVTDSMNETVEYDSDTDTSREPSSEKLCRPRRHPSPESSDPGENETATSPSLSVDQEEEEMADYSSQSTLVEEEEEEESAGYGSMSTILEEEEEEEFAGYPSLSTVVEEEEEEESATYPSLSVVVEEEEEEESADYPSLSGEEEEETALH